MASATIHGKAEELPTPPQSTPARNNPKRSTHTSPRWPSRDPCPISTSKTRQEKAAETSATLREIKRKSSRQHSAGKVLVSKVASSNDGHVEVGFALQVRHQQRPSHPRERFLRYASRISTLKQARHAFSRPGVRVSARHFSLPQQSDPDNSNICRGGRLKERQVTRLAPC